jgi:competence protein ComEA
VASAGDAEGVDLNSATYDELRGLKLSVTQTGRVLAYRERAGSFTSVDDLDSIPGFGRDFLADLKTKLRV